MDTSELLVVPRGIGVATALLPKRERERERNGHLHSVYIFFFNGWDVSSFLERRVDGNAHSFPNEREKEGWAPSIFLGVGGSQRPSSEEKEKDDHLHSVFSS